MAALERLMERFSLVLLWVAGLAVTLMMLHIAADVVGKYVFNRPVAATLEIVAWYYMIATIFLPVCFIQVRKKHLMVELFTRQMAPRPLAVLEGLIAILGAIYVGTLFWLTLEHALDATVEGELQDVTYFDLPVWPSRWYLPVAFGGMAIVMVLQAIRDLTFGLTGQGTPTQRQDDGIVIEEG